MNKTDQLAHLAAEIVVKALEEVGIDPSEIMCPLFKQMSLSWRDGTIDKAEFQRRSLKIVQWKRLLNASKK